MIEQANGTVTRIRGSKVYVRMDDGSKTVVGVPWLTRVEVGMRIATTESGDGVPLVRWGGRARETTGAAHP